MQGWINEQIRNAAPRWIERYREDIRQYIIARVDDWNAEEMTTSSSATSAGTCSSSASTARWWAGWSAW